MKKRVLTIILAIALTAGSISPAVPSYAQENTVSEDSALLFGSTEDPINEDASEDASFGASLETLEDEAADEATEEAFEEATADDEGKETAEEAASEEKPAAEDEAAADTNDEEAEELTDDTTENEASEEASETDEAASFASSEEPVIEEVIEDEELVEVQKGEIKEGYDPTNHYAFKDGKLITGWICATFNNGGNYDIVATGSKALSTQTGYVYYIDPGTGRAVRGMNVIGGKKYLFDSMDCYLRRGEPDGKILNINDGTTNVYMVKPSGEIYTGWQKDYYFDPTTGILATKKWVAKGKGITYLDYNGRMTDTLGNALTTGLYYIEGEYYYFRAGLRASGLIYFDDKNEATTKDKASYARFFDSETGALRTGYFKAGGKYYFAGDYDFYDPEAEGNSFDRSMYYGTIELDLRQQCHFDGEYFYVFSDKSGTLLTNKLFTNKGKKLYAKSDGKLCTNEYMLINGKWCFFDGSSIMVDNAADAEGKKTGFYSYVEGADSVSSSCVFTKSKSAKDTDGVFFYADKECTRKLTNCWLVESSDIQYVDITHKYYLDKNGNPVKGLVKIGDRKFLFDSKTGLIKEKTYKENGIYTYSVIKLSGKNYLLSYYGEIISREGFVYIGSKDVFYVKKDGTAAVGLTTINGRKYYFDSEGKLVYDQTICINGKIYNLNDYYKQGKAEDCYILEKKDYPTEYGTAIMINSDGSLYSGWKTIKGKKYFYNCGYSLGHDSAGSKIKRIFEINGKYYSFSEDGYARTGEFTIKAEDEYEIVSLSSMAGYYEENNNEGDKKDLKFYFDPKTCAAVTGFKTINKKTYYFRTTKGAKPYECVGTMVCGDTVKVNGRYYTFDDSGVLVSKTAPGKNQIKEGNTKVSYYVSPRTGEIETGVIRRTGSKWFFYGEDGAQCTELTTRNMDNEEIKAVFNKDGSINGFYKGDVKQTNIMIGGSDNLWDFYFLDSKGNFITGFKTLPTEVSLGITGTPDAKVYVESDGYCERTHNPLLQYTSLIKSGKKIYALINAITVSDTNKRYPLTDYSMLPESDRKVLERYEKTHRMYANDCGNIYMPESNRYLYFSVNSDGSLASDQTRLVYSRYLHLNKYGIAKEDLGMFIKVGKDWYLSELVRASDKKFVGLKLEISYIDRENEDMAEIKVGADRKLSQAMNLRTGKPLDGIYQVYDSDLLVEGSDQTFDTNLSSFFIQYKNGYPVGKKCTFKFGGLNAVLNCDPDTGWSLDIPAMKIN